MQKNKYMKIIYLFLALLTMLITSFVVYADENSVEENISTLSEIATNSNISSVSEIIDEEELLLEEEILEDDSYNIDTNYLFFDYLYKDGVRLASDSELRFYESPLDENIKVERGKLREGKKGFLIVDNVREVDTLNVSQVAINVTTSGLTYLTLDTIKELYKKGISITAILVNDKPPIGFTTEGAHPAFKNPYLYMLDFYANNGLSIKLNTQKIIEKYGDYIDNWIVGNEISSQLYGYYGPSDVREYTERYLRTFKEVHDMVKEKNPSAHLYISFDQGWNRNELNPKHRNYDKELGKFAYNTKEQIDIIAGFLDKSVDYNFAFHPYPVPLEDSKFWDDRYAGVNETGPMKDRPIFMSMNNIEYFSKYITTRDYLLRPDGTPRKILISEYGLTSDSGETVQAAALAFTWEKIKNDDNIVGFLYNAQVDVPDGFHFGLRKNLDTTRLAWVVFRDMDDENKNTWIKSFLYSIVPKAKEWVEAMEEKEDNNNGNKEINN